MHKQLSAADSCEALLPCCVALNVQVTAENATGQGRLLCHTLDWKHRSDLIAQN